MTIATVWSGRFSDLGTQVFVYRPEVSPDLAEITDEPGFGSAWNKYAWSSELFDGGDADSIAELYVGTFNVELDPVGVFAGAVRIAALLDVGSFGDPSAILSLLAADFPKTLASNGGEIHAYDFVTASWTQVLGPGEIGLDAGDVGFREMTAFDGTLFAATSRGLIYNILNGSDNPAKIVVSSDGTTWSELSGGPLDPSRGNSSIRSMVVVEDPDGQEVLLVGTENLSGAETWSYDQDGNWQLVAKFPGAPLTHAETYSFDGKIFLGTWAPYGLFELDLSQPIGSNLTPVTPNLPIDDQGVMQMIGFDGYLYLGSVNYTGGASLLRSMDPGDPDSWEVITTDGFVTDGEGEEMLGDELAALGIERIVYTWQTAVVDGVLYIGDFDGSRGLLLESEDGTTFEIVEDGAGEPLSFGSAAYGIRQMLPVALDEEGVPVSGAPANALIVGSADDFTAAVPLADRQLDGEVIVGKPLQPNLLIGGEADDVVIGGFAGDGIGGRAGDDLLIALLSPPVFALPGEVAASETPGDLPPPQPDLVKGGDGADWVLGNLGDDILEGQDGEDLQVGGPGRDMISGGADIDLIFGDFFSVGEEGLALFGPILELAGLSAAALGAGLSPPALDGAAIGEVAAGLQGFLVEQYGEEAAAAVLGELGGLLHDLQEGDLPGFVNGLYDLATDLLGAAIDPFLVFEDRIGAGLGNDIVFAGLGEDQVNGHRGNDLLFGDAGDDWLRGDADSDILRGGVGDDHLFGGAGVDFLDGGEGDDSLVGGSGADVFGFGLAAGWDSVSDFKNGLDAIDLRDYGIDPANIATVVLPAVSSLGGNAIGIDLTALGGSGHVTVKGLSLAEVDADDFWL